MQNKILFFFLSILIITSVNGAERTLGETVEINLGNEWAKDVRARKFINKLCPAYTKDNNEEEKKVLYIRYKYGNSKIRMRRL